MITRGERNNNPGNIRVSSQPWQGKIVPSPDVSFEAFDTYINGIRAIAKILITYYHKGLDTIPEIIGAWAPANENNTKAYIDAVAKEAGFFPNKDGIHPAINILDLKVMAAIVHAIIYHENGRCVYPLDRVTQSCRLALDGL